MSSPAVTALNPRQQRTVGKLLDAGEVELREAGLDAVTVRTVAARAGVSSATAYTYLASKDHLFALMFLRHLQASAPEITGDRPVTRVQSLTRALAADLASSPELAAAATRALLGTDPAVDRVRRRIGAEYAARFRTALGDAAAGRGVLETLLLTFLGALLQAGMGMSTYPAVAEQLQRSIELILR